MANKGLLFVSSTPVQATLGWQSVRRTAQCMIVSVLVQTSAHIELQRGRGAQQTNRQSLDERTIRENRAERTKNGVVAIPHFRA